MELHAFNTSEEDLIPASLLCAGGEPLGEPPAPPLRSAEPARPVSEEVVEEARRYGTTRASISPLDNLPESSVAILGL